MKIEYIRPHLLSSSVSWRVPEHRKTKKREAAVHSPTTVPQGPLPAHMSTVVHIYQSYITVHKAVGESLSQRTTVVIQARRRCKKTRCCCSCCPYRGQLDLAGAALCFSQLGGADPCQVSHSSSHIKSAMFPRRKSQQPLHTSFA
jgi:hypothetical protein